MSVNHPKHAPKGRQKHNGAVRTIQERKDDSIMNTNDSSIVSKKSVSRLYFPEEPDFYEPFVQKHIRRNPLINRGYWLRMHAIEQVVRQFLEEHPHQSKVVVNLGCGYDPLPFQFWHRHPQISKKAVFVDVDYPQLIRRKRDRILTNGVLRDLLLATKVQPSQAPVCLRSKQYMALGCDLRDLETLERVLKSEIDLSSSSILFVAEVSLTYMPVADSDSLIRWASTLGSAHFCLLEQYLPQGSSHPFASTMLRHFDKLQTPIQAVQKYASLNQQSSRFSDAGWPTVHICNLWDLWSDDAFTSPSLRRGLDAVEPFDEWEEYALFSAHYFLLIASNAAAEKPMGIAVPSGSNMHGPRVNGSGARSLKLTYHVPSRHSSLTPRRLGAAFSLGCNTVAFHGGQGPRSRLTSVEVLEREALPPKIQPCPRTPPQARMCHTVTPINDTAALLAGGRGSPAGALADCWLIEQGVWRRVHDLSPARFRHSSVKVTIPSSGSDIEGVLVFGGKTSNGTVLDDCMFWTPCDGWRSIPVDGKRPSPRFGAAISSMGPAQDRGLLVGGFAPSGVVLEEVWEWHVSAAPRLQLKFADRTNDVQQNAADTTYGRAGSSLLAFGNSLLLIGGVSKSVVHRLSDDIVAITCDGPMIRIDSPVVSLPETIWPLLVGVGVAAVSHNELVVAGGGAVCFSMGSFWNEGYLTITEEAASMPMWTVAVSQNPETANPRSSQKPLRINGEEQGKTKAAGPRPEKVSRVQLHSSEAFADILAASRPVIFEGLDIGLCTELWTLDYLREKIGQDREVVIHQCDSSRMTFKDKNFQYVMKPFGEFLSDISGGSNAYLRAVSSSRPNKLSTRLEADFPTIAGDFVLPDVFSFIKANYHSSPLRISGPVALWLHYDVLANVLCQIRGAKTLRLYPPSDVKHLSYPPGGSSSNVDVLTSKDPALRHTHPRVATLNPGDVLFIPPMWSHTAVPEEGISVAVNVFFRNLETGYAAGRDVYGNRDLQAYENGRRDVERIAKAFKNVPPDLAKFYLDRLAAELQEKADALG